MQSEGQPKAEQSLGFEMDSAEVETIAAFIPASKQILDDSPALATLIDNELRYAVLYKEETQLLLGDGTGNQLFGLIPQATAFSAPFTATSEQMIDLILEAKTHLAASEIEATGCIVNAADWSRMLSLKDDEGRYIIPGGPFAVAPPVLWGMDAVPTNAMTVDKFLVGDFKRAATIYDRQETTVEVSTEHDDYFVRNLVAIRAEERLALTVTMPEALVYGDFGNS
jgi:HK97 family phage major capsid protein